MEFELSEKVRELRERVVAFMDERVYPAEPEVAAFVERTGGTAIPPVIEDLKRASRDAGLWNLWMPNPEYGPGLSNLEYAPLCEVMGRSLIGPEIFNCSFPDTGNMEVLAQFGTAEQQRDMAVSAARRGDPLGVRPDRARVGVVGSDQHPVDDLPRWGGLPRQRTQVVHQRRVRSTL